MSALAAYESGLRAGGGCAVRLTPHLVVDLPINRWLQAADASDSLMLDRCEGPTLDVGCGAGRLTVALIQRGVEAVGLDISKEAVRIARARGAMARQGDVFDERPTQPQWQHLLLADGNIGIGGCPASLLKHARSLVGESGSVLVDVESFGRGVRAGHVEVMAHGYAGWMRWARVGLDAIEGLACTAGLVVTSVVDDGLDRHVVELRWA